MKKCAFCTRPADSREHIFSDWMLEMLPRGERYVFNERNVKTGEYVSYKGRRVKLTAKVVCTSCNNHWMSDLENDVAKPAMQNLLMGEHSANLDSTARRWIAVFAFKTLILANHKDSRTTPFYGSADRVRFRKELAIPNGVQVWMATRAVIPGKYYGVWKSASGLSDQASPHGFATYICTWNFQNLVLQIVAMKWKDKRRKKTIPVGTLVQNEDWRGISLPIWPITDDAIKWPAAVRLADEAFTAFRDRFDNFAVSFPF